MVGEMAMAAEMDIALDRVKPQLGNLLGNLRSRKLK